ncbi:hypothetical protein GCM10027610_126170 [Dactylosporangium cerinum]
MRVVPRELNVDAVSSVLVTVLFTAAEPTDSTDGSLAGLVSVATVPVLPPAATTTMPLRQAFSTA